MSSEIPQLVTYSHVKRMLNTALYQPILRFRRVAAVLAALERGDAAPYYSYTLSDDPAGRDPSSPLRMCSAETVPPTTPMPALVEGTDDALPAIMCADAEALTHATVADFARYARRLHDMSPVAGDVQVVHRLACVGRAVRPRWRFPLGSLQGQGPGAPQYNTSAPVLFVANSADNITPRVSAQRNAAMFRAAVVLTQNSYGHTTLSTASGCTARYVRAYFQHGTLPPEGAVCEPDTTPFGDGDVAAVADRHRDHDDDDDDELHRALRRLAYGGRWPVWVKW